MTTQNKFAFFANFSEAIKALPPEKQAGAYQAICEYGIYGTLPDDPIYLGLCLMAKASIYKEDGRRNNGGNHNPTGINQHSEKGQSGQSRSILVNSDKDGQILSETETETETRNGNIETETEDEKESTKEKVTIITPFDEFWSFYPKQRAGSKDKARIAFQRAVNEHRATAEQIIASCKVYAKSDEVARGFAKGAAAWLNDDRFNNDYTPPKTKQQIAFEKAYGELQELYNEDDHESEVANVG